MAVSKKRRRNTDMKKILLLDTNQAFTSDVESRLILDSIDDADIIIGTNFDNVLISKSINLRNWF